MNNLILTQKQVDNLNILSSFLSLTDPLPKTADLLILLGSSLVDHLELISRLYFTHSVSKILIVGGIGHSTTYLYANISKHEHFRKYFKKGMTESDLYATILHLYFGVPNHSIYIENLSTNCGNNASYSYTVALKSSLILDKCILCQDPTMQLRSYYSFLKEWKNTNIQWFNFPPFHPILIRSARGAITFQNLNQPPWSISRFIQLLMGEIPRLTDNKFGYGPKGKNFIGHVDIPLEVQQAYYSLKNSYLFTR